MHRFSLLSALAPIVLASACGGAAPGDSTPPPDDPVNTPRELNLRFKAVVGTESWVCGREYPHLGTADSTYSPRDFRFYVSNVRLVDASGVEWPVTVPDEAPWQHGGVTMLDFEDATGDCEGTELTRDIVKGTAVVPTGLASLRFTLGVPFELNHADFSRAAAPLNSSAMAWGWEQGLKFAKLDGGIRAGNRDKPHTIHLGSTGCETTAPNHVASCAAGNRVEVELAGFDADHSVVLADLASLVQTTDLSQELSGPAIGCMSSPLDLDCPGIFERLGLPFGDALAGPQHFFRLE